MWMFLDAFCLLTDERSFTYGSSLLLTVGEPQAKKTKPIFGMGGTVGTKD